jgi:hypothetical protein
MPLWWFGGGWNWRSIGSLRWEVYGSVKTEVGDSYIQY